jgi:parallel beta-helix repeat protein
MLKKTFVVLLILLGSLSALVQVDTGLLRTCSAGPELYHEGSAKAVDRSGNVYVTGPSSEVLGEGQSYVTAKYDQAGNLIWVARCNYAAGDENLTGSVTLDEIGNLRVRLANSKGEEVAIICYSPVGDQKWVRRYDNSAEGVSKKVGASADLLRAPNGLSYEEGWPVILSGGTFRHVSAGDIDNDGTVEIVVSEYLPPFYGGSGDGHVYVFRYDGTPMDPWPNVDIDAHGLNPREVSLGDLDGDGDLELVFCTGDVPVSPNYSVYIFHHDGTKVTDGWPKVLATFAAVSPVLEDIDNDGSLEIISKDGQDRISAWNFDGSNVAGWPFVLPGAGPLNYIAIGDIDNDLKKEIVAVQSSLVHKCVYVVSDSGQLLTSWDITDNIINVAAFPALADLDKDGDLEILLYAYFKLHAYHQDGQYVNGWPVLASPTGHGGVPLCIGDMDRNARLEVPVCAHSWQDGMSVWAHDGSLVEGWPVILNEIKLGYASSIGNIDGDGELEVMVNALNRNSWQNEIYAFNWNGNIVEDFPFVITDSRFGLVGNVVLQDTDQDGIVEAIFAAQTASPTDLFMVGVVSVEGPYDSLSMEWPMFQRDRGRSGIYWRGTIYVDDDNTAGPWDGTEEFPYQYIQDGIDNANPLDMVFVFDGTYHENVLANESVYLVGEHSDSTVIDAGGSGAGITITADLVTIWGFTIQNGDQSGVHVGSDHNIIFGNNIIDNYYGIYLASSEANSIYHNNFINNTQNAYDESDNLWDDGYPSSGNYWDDYSGADIYYGPNQDIPGSDNIGDTPYIISGGSSQDKYPLMTPWTGTPPVLPRDTVYVDDDFDETTPGWRWDHFDNIGDGIFNVLQGGPVYVANGTYHENVVVNKSVCLVGEHRDSTVINAGGSGAGISLTADLVTICGFTVQNSDQSGISVSSDSNTISDNSIADNYYGIYVASAESNHIYHNNFINNTQNAYDEGDNIWDDGYPSCGNYWDDYSGSDMYYGPNQDIPGSDGVGDTQYLISGGSAQDRYPLVDPWTGSSPVPPRDTVYVDDDFDQTTPGWGWIRFDNIQEAVDSALFEGFVFVANGTYYENISIDKSINLIGENKDSCVIDGGAAGDVILFNRAGGVNLSGFTIRNGRYGVFASYETSNNTVFDNIVIGNEVIGVYLAFSCSSTISDNIIANTNTYGIDLHSSFDNIVSGNTVTGSEYGIILYHSSHNVVYDNILRENEFGVYARSSDYHQIYHNDFINNTQSAYDNEANAWDDGYPSGGNYWSDFDEPGEGAYDENGDGIVDSPYSIPGGGSQDRYPLMHPHNYVMHGDANGDGRISISDVVFLISYLFRDGPAPDPLEAGDANCDEMVNGEDVLYLINYLFRGGPPPSC